jgi:hypothetical protein
MKDFNQGALLKNRPLDPHKTFCLEKKSGLKLQVE